MSAAELPLEAAPPPPPPRRGLPALAAGVIAWPRNTFAYLRDHGGRSWLAPLGLALVLTLAARLIAQPIERAQAEALQAEIQAQIDAMQGANGDPANGDGSPNYVVGPMGAGGPVATGGPATSNPVADLGLPLLGVLGDWALRGGALLALAWVLGGRPSAGAMFRMSGWTFLPDIVRLLVAIGVMLALGRVPARGLAGLGQPADGAQISISPTDGTGGVVSSDGGSATYSDGETEGPQNNVITFGPGGPVSGLAGGVPFLAFLQGAFLSSLDIYLLWALVLLGIGVAVTARLGWLKAGLATLLYFGLSIVLAAVPPLVTLMVMQLNGPGIIVP